MVKSKRPITQSRRGNTMGRLKRPHQNFPMRLGPIYINPPPHLFVSCDFPRDQVLKSKGAKLHRNFPIVRLKRLDPKLRLRLAFVFINPGPIVFHVSKGPTVGRLSTLYIFSAPRSIKPLFYLKFGFYVL